jgi:hypothetical protein
VRKLEVQLLAILILIPVGCSQGHEPARKPGTSTQAQIRKMILSLPEDSSVRRSLEMGQYGDGVHESWMDHMQEAGLREVVFEIHGVWRTGLGFKPKGVGQVIYRTKYDGPGAQLTDPAQISQIEKSGLEAELREAAIRKAGRATWPFEAKFSALGITSFAYVSLFDNEWIADRWRSTNTPVLGSYDPNSWPLTSAAQVGDLLSVSTLLKTRDFSKEDLDNALFAAVSYPSDNTDVIRRLVESGADPNASRSYGTTVLMEAVDFSNENNMKLLVAMGANRAQKNHAGDTALSILQKRTAGAPKPIPSYVQRLISLLNFT